MFRKHEHGPALYLKNLGVVYGQVSKAGWKKLQGVVAETDDIAATAPMQAIRGLGSNAPPPTAPQTAWGVAQIQAPALWQQGLTGKGVLIAHLDTGIDGEHPSLKPAVAQFADFDATGHVIDGAADRGFRQPWFAHSGDHRRAHLSRAADRSCARMPTGKCGSD